MIVKVTLVVMYLLNPTLPPYAGNLERVYYEYSSLEECKKAREGIHNSWLKIHDKVTSFCLVERWKQ